MPSDPPRGVTTNSRQLAPPPPPPHFKKVIYTGMQCHVLYLLYSRVLKRPRLGQFILSGLYGEVARIKVATL